MYGWSDLDAYGEWGFFPGFGYGWSPFASMGWSPYSMGMWSMYPGMGYTWISGEPWGWLPYHYGSWNFSPGFGCFWMPGSFDAAWSPALVSWYSGPGWIGWAPMGLLGGAGRGVVTTVPGRAIQTGQMIGPSDVTRVPTTAGTLVSRMPLQASEAGTLPGARLEASVFTSHAATTHTMAPASILMVGDAAKEQSMLGGRFAHQPLRARLGTTLGGAMAVGGAVGEFRGDAFRGQGAAQWPKEQAPQFSRGAGAPVLLPHGQQQSSAPRESGGGGMMGSGGGSGVANSSASPMGSVSTGHSVSSAPSGGGHH